MENLGGLKLLLNGGKREMAAATIPVQWFFSDEVLAKKPNCILLIEQNEEEFNSDGRFNRGRRYLCDIDEAVKFIQLYRPGTHKLSALAFKKRSESVESLLKYVNHDGVSYSYPIEFKTNEVVIDIRGCESPQILAATVVTFDIPEQLFAARPQTKFSKAVWWWVNFGQKNEPVDQCDYRRRLIHAFTWKIPVVLFCFLLIHLVGGTFYALFILIASLTCFFFGFRPKPILKGMWQAFSFTGYKTYEVVRPHIPEYECGYKNWSWDEDKQKAIYMPVSPVEIALLLSLGYLAYKYIPCVGLYAIHHIPLTLICTACLIVFILIIMQFPKIEEMMEKKTKQKKLRQEKALKLFLAQFSWDNVPEDGAVDLKKLAKPLSAKKSIVQRFRVAYWATKAQVCKPFSK